GPSTDPRGGQRPDEPGHGPDVALLGRLLLGRALPEGRAAVHPGAAPDGAQQCPARRHAGGAFAGGDRRRARDPRALGARLLRRRVEARPLAVAAPGGDILSRPAHPLGARSEVSRMETLVVNQDEVPRLLPMRECIDVMARAFGALVRGEASMPQRQIVWMPDRSGALGLMPAYASDRGALGVKAVTFFPRNEGTEIDS